MVALKGLRPVPVLSILFIGTACSPEADFDVRDAATCNACVLELDDSSVQFQDSETAPLQLPAFIVATDDGFVTVGLDTDHILFRYDSLGNHMATVERQGQGPMEFMRIASLVSAPNGLIALDAGNQRRTILTPSLDVADETSLQFRPQWRGHARTDGGQEFVKTTVRTETGGYQGVAPLLPDGSLGPPVQWPHERVRGLGLMPVPATDSTVWVFDFDTAHIVEFGLQGAPLREVPPPPWFEVGVPQQGARDGDASPVNMSLVSVAQGSEWLFALYSVRDLGWDDVAPTGSRDRIAVLDDMRDSILNVIDPDTGETLAALRMDAYAEFVLPDQRLVQVGLTPRGDPRVTIRRIRLSGPNP